MMDKLSKWKEEKSRRKLVEKLQTKQKPAFKVGIVHHRAFSPPTNKENHQQSKGKLCKNNVKTEVPRRISKATEKRLANKAAGIEKPKLPNNLLKKKKATNQIKHIMSNTSLAPKDHQFKAPEGVIAIPLFGRQAISSKENVGTFSFSAEGDTILNPSQGKMEFSSLPSLNGSHFLNDSHSVANSTFISKSSDQSRTNVSSINITNNSLKPYNSIPSVEPTF